MILLELQKKYWCDRTRILSDCWLGLAIISTYPSKIICWGLKIAYEGLRMYCKLTRPLLYLYSGRSLSTWASRDEPVPRTSATWEFGKDWCHSDSAGPQTLQSCWYDLHSYYCIKGQLPKVSLLLTVESRMRYVYQHCLMLSLHLWQSWVDNNDPALVPT